MKTIAGILFLAVLALAGHRASFVRILPSRTGVFFLTGTEFLVVGYLLSESFLGILDAATLERVRPFLILGLGWIGLLSGIQLEGKALRTFGGTSYLWILLHGCCVLLLVSVGLYVLLRVWFPADPELGLAVAALSVTALCTAQASIALWMQQAPDPKRPLGVMLQFVSSVNDVIAIVLFGLVVGFYQPARAGAGVPLPPLEKFVFSLLIGVLMGLLLLVLLRTRLGEVDKIVVVIGLVLFGGGMAYLLGISPLLVHLVAGVILANFSLKSEETFQLLMRIERPLYLIFLMIAGAYLRIGSPLVLLLAVAYVVLRALSQGIAGGAFLRWVFRVPEAPRLSRSPGWGLLSQAGLGVALAVHFHLWIAEPSSVPILNVAFSVLLLAILLNELISPVGLAYVTKEK